MASSGIQLLFVNCRQNAHTLLPEKKLERQKKKQYTQNIKKAMDTSFKNNWPL